MRVFSDRPVGWTRLPSLPLGPNSQRSIAVVLGGAVDVGRAGEVARAGDPAVVRGAGDRGARRAREGEALEDHVFGVHQAHDAVEVRLQAVGRAHDDGRGLGALGGDHRRGVVAVGQHQAVAGHRAGQRAAQRARVGHVDGALAGGQAAARPCPRGAACCRRCRPCRRRSRRRRRRCRRCRRRCRALPPVPSAPPLPPVAGPPPLLPPLPALPPTRRCPPCPSRPRPNRRWRWRPRPRPRCPLARRRPRRRRWAPGPAATPGG